MKNTNLSNQERTSTTAESGFSLIELIITLTITLTVLGLAFTLLAQALNTNVREDRQASVLSDSNQGLGRMAEELANAGFGLSTNGIVAADSNEDQIRIRANLNSLMKQTTSNSVSDRGEDVEFMLATNAAGETYLVREDIALGTTSILASSVDNTDIDGDGEGDGLNFVYLDSTSAVVDPDQADRVNVTLRLRLPQVGVPGAVGYRPGVTKALTENIVIRNASLAAY